MTKNLLGSRNEFNSIAKTFINQMHTLETLFGNGGYIEERELIKRDALYKNIGHVRELFPIFNLLKRRLRSGKKKFQL